MYSSAGGAGFNSETDTADHGSCLIEIGRLVPAMARGQDLRTAIVVTITVHGNPDGRIIGSKYSTKLIQT